MEVGFAAYLRTRASNAYQPNVQCTLNVYGSDAVVREDWGVENSPAKSGSLFAFHTDTLSFISIDSENVHKICNTIHTISMENPVCSKSRCVMHVDVTRTRDECTLEQPPRPACLHRSDGTNQVCS